MSTLPNPDTSRSGHQMAGPFKCPDEEVLLYFTLFDNKEKNSFIIEFEYGNNW